MSSARELSKAIRTSRRTAASARRDIIKMSSEYDKRDRRIAALAELPAGRVARVNHRASQAAQIVEAAQAVVYGYIAIRTALMEFRHPTSSPPQIETSSDEAKPSEE